MSWEKDNDRQVLEHLGALRKGLMCGICNGFLRDAYNLPCGHNFCQECVNGALAHKNVCPDCKNPAWQKDTLKTAQADSAVNEWVSACEATYQALVVRAAEDDDDSDSTFSEVSSRDGEGTRQHHPQGEEGAEETPWVTSSTNVQQTSPLPERNAGGAGAVANAKASSHDQVSNGVANVSDVVERCASFRDAGPSVVGALVPLATAPETAGASAKPTPVARHYLEQLNYNVASPLRRASSSFSQEAVTPGAIPSNRKLASHVLFQRSQDASDGQPSSQNEAPAAENSVHKENCDPGGSLRVDGLLSVGRAGPEVTDVEFARGSGASPQVEAPGAGQVMADSTTISPPAMPATRVWYQPSPHPGTPEKSCSAVTSQLLSVSRGMTSGRGEVKSHYPGALPETCDVLGFDSLPHSLATNLSNGLIGTPPTLKASRAEMRVDGGDMAALGVLCADTGDEASPSVLDESGGGGYGGERCEGGLSRMTVDGASSKVSSTFGGRNCEAQNRNRHSGSQGSLAERTDGEQSFRMPMSPPALRTRIGGNEETSRGEELTCLAGKSETRHDGGRVGANSVDSAGLGKGSAGESGHVGLARVDSACVDDGGTHAAESTASQGGRGDFSDAESLPLFVVADQENDAQRTPSRDVASSPVQRASQEGVDGFVREDGTGGGNGGEVDEEEDEETCDEAEVEENSAAHLEAALPTNAATTARGSNELTSQNSGNLACPGMVALDAKKVGVSRERADASHQRSVVCDRTGDCENVLVGDTEDANIHLQDCETRLPGRAVAGGEALSSGLALGLVDTRPADGGNAERAATGELGSENLSSDVVSGAVAPSRSATPKEMRERSQTSEALTQSVALHGESCSDRQGDVMHRQGRDDCDAGLRVVETPAQTVGAPDGAGNRSAVALLGAEDGTNREVVMSAPPAESFLMSRAPARDAALLSHGMLDSARSESQVQETPVVDAVLRLRVGERNETLAVCRHEGQSSEGGLDTEVRSLVVGATQEPIKGGGERASTDRGRNGIGRQSVSADSRQKLRGGVSGLGSDLSECGRPVGDTSGESNESVDGQDVPETVPADRVEAEVERCGVVRGVLCLATQEASERDGAQNPVADEGVQGEDDQGQVSRQVLETAAQSLSTQEVPETAETFKSSSLAALDDTHETAQGESVTATAKSSSYAQSDALGIPQVRGTPTENTVDETIATCDEEGCVLRGAGSTRTTPSNTQSERSGTQARGRGGCTEGSPGVFSPDNSRSSPASPLSSACGENGHSEGSTPTRKSPDSGGLKRSVDSAISPEASSSEMGSAEKRLRVTPAGKQPSTRSEVFGEGDASLGAGMAHTEGAQPGAPIIIGGGSGPEEVDGKCEFEVSHNLAAAQDAWGAEGGYGGGGEHFECDEDVCSEEDNMVDGFVGDGDGVEVSVGLRRSKGGKTRPGKLRQVVNPYTPIAHLELQPDEDHTPATAETPLSKSPLEHTRKGRQGVAKQKLRRPSTETMSFGAPSGSGVGIARRPCGLENRSVGARIREKHMHASSNKILAAGRDEDWRVASLGDSLSHSLGPDTEQVAALAARLSRAGRRGDEADADIEIDTDKDVVDLNKGNVSDDGGRLSRRRTSMSQRTSAGRKRPRGGVAACEEGGAQRTTPSYPKTRPVIVLLDCEQWEIDRAKKLCQKTGQRRLHTSLVQDATHVVLGSKNTLERSCDGNSDDCDEGCRRRHELVVHGSSKGYLEAVMLGLWVVDMFWVEDCLDAEKCSSSFGGVNDTTHDTSDGRVVSFALAPPRDYELLGCSQRHKGCVPRRGRVTRCLGVPGVFDGLSFCVLGPGSSGPEKERLERILKLGGGAIVATALSNRGDDDGEWTNEPFASSPTKKSRFNDSGCGQLSEIAGTVVLVVLYDRSNGGISRKLAEEAIGRSKKIGAEAAVVQDWILRSVENGEPVKYGEHPLPRLSSESPLPHKDTTGGLCGRNNDRVKHPRKKGSLSLNGAGQSGSVSRQREVVYDVERKRHDRRHRTSLDNAKPQESELLREAQKVVDAKDRLQKDAAAVRASKAPELGAEKFEFTRVGSNKQPMQVRGCAADKSASKGESFTEVNKAERVLWQALNDAGYLCLPDERGLGMFWMDFVNDGILVKTTERWERTAKERGCPFKVIKGVYEGNEVLRSEKSKKRMDHLLEEFDLWEAPSVEEVVNLVGKGRGADDTVEVL